MLSLLIHPLDSQGGFELLPLNYLEELVTDQRTHNAAVIPLSAALFGVKFSFLFFRLLLQRTSTWYIV